jgi:hypothetical protein
LPGRAATGAAREGRHSAPADRPQTTLNDDRALSFSHDHAGLIERHFGKGFYHAGHQWIILALNPSRLQQLKRSDPWPIRGETANAASAL